jgi:membrane protease YdiL (CAAX protease family)
LAEVFSRDIAAMNSFLRKKESYERLIDEMSHRELLFHLFATQIILLTISAVLGIILFDSKAEFFSLFIWNDPAILYIGGLAGGALVLADLALMKRLPPAYYDDGGLNQKIFGNASLFQIAMIAGIVAFSEEVLFRGILQTNFGLIVSSAIFALVHYRYLFNWFLFLNITLLSFFIGILFWWTENLLVTIFMHFIIDFLLGWYMKHKQETGLSGRE